MLGFIDDEVAEVEAAVVLCEPATADDAEEDEGRDAATEVLDIDVIGKEDPRKVLLEVLDALDATEDLEVLVVEVGPIVVIGSDVDEIAMVETEVALEAVGMTVDDMLTDTQSVEIQ